MADTRGQAEVLINYPIEEGLTAGTQKQTGRQMNLIAEESIVEEKEKAGFT